MGDLGWETDTHSEQSLLHVETHFFVIQAHDTYEALESAYLDCDGAALGSLAYNLHDVVTLAL